jgi:hypothetical protein
VVVPQLILKWRIDVYLKQMVIEFFVAEGGKPTCIQEHLQKVYGEATVDVNAV